MDTPSVSGTPHLRCNPPRILPSPYLLPVAFTVRPPPPPPFHFPTEVARGSKEPAGFSHPSIPHFHQQPSPAYAGTPIQLHLPSPRTHVPPPSHRIVPCTPKTPNPVRPNPVFFSRAPLGARSCCFVLPRPSALPCRLGFYGTLGVCRSVTTCNFIQGRRYSGGRPNHGGIARCVCIHSIFPG